MSETPSADDSSTLIIVIVALGLGFLAIVACLLKIYCCPSSDSHDWPRGLDENFLPPGRRLPNVVGDDADVERQRARTLSTITELSEEGSEGGSTYEVSECGAVENAVDKSADLAGEQDVPPARCCCC